MTSNQARLEAEDIPDGMIQVAFSGGRTSGYMLYLLRHLIHEEPSRFVVSFQNTGREMPETLDFVQECSRRWVVPVVWLEYRPEAPLFAEVSHATASRGGEPFEALLRRRKYLPNQAQRFCTEELKIRTARRYLRQLGWDKWSVLTGIRADEPRRLNKPQPKERWTVHHPLAALGVTIEDVNDFWASQPFNLQLPTVNGRTLLGNCDGCFLKSEHNLAALCRDHPERHEWWERMESMVSGLTRSPAGARFSKRYGRGALRDFMERQGDWVLSTEGALCQESGGECT